MTETFPIKQPIWCAGCGHFGVLAAMDASFDRLEIPRHDALVLAGIGCSGTVQNHMPYEIFFDLTSNMNTGLLHYIRDKHLTIIYKYRHTIFPRLFVLPHP